MNAPERTRKMHTLILQRLSSVSQAEVARRIEVSDATISRLVSSEAERTSLLERLYQVLVALNLKMVPAQTRCFEPRKVEILMELSRDHLNQLQNVEQLTWE